MKKSKRRPALTKKQKEEYAKVPITKADEAKLAAFLKVKPKGPPKKNSDAEE